ncbi:MAG TPA: VCBS repeat-containing protein [Blastocatellia bacterium]|nr:VCBS repeat-containing protein [Blastocatellia bacterium]
MRKRLTKLAKASAILAAVVAIIVFGILYKMARDDREHNRFYNTGKSVNSFLKDYNHGLGHAFKTHDVAAVATFYSENYVSPGRGDWRMKHDNDTAAFSCYRFEKVGDRDFTRGDVSAEVSSYLRGITAIDDSKLKIDMIEKLEPERMVVLTVKFILDGKDPQGLLFQDRCFYRWHLINEDPGEGAAYDWKIVRDELVEGVRVSGDGREFLQADLKRCGIDYRHQRDPKLNIKNPDVTLKFGVMEHGFGGVSAADYDGDGRSDIFFADGVRSRLYRNTGLDRDHNTTFSDVTSQSGLDGIDQAGAGIFADLDNDGDEDLFVTRYMAPCELFINNGDGTFVDRSSVMKLDLVAPAISACFLDYDRDGYVDLYVGVYGNAFTDIPRLPFFATNGGANRLFHNDAGAGFTDVTVLSGTGDTGWSLAVASADYDNDGYPDLMVANDFGRKTLYRNKGDGTFTDAAKEAGVLDFSGGMGLAWGDFNDDGYLDVYTSNINSNQRWFGEDMTVSQYMRNVLRSKWSMLDAGEYWKVYNLLGPHWTNVGKMIGEGNSLFCNNGDGTFRELNDSHTNRAGWGWSVAFFDLDNDTGLDIYAANGWISNTPDTDL